MVKRIRWSQIVFISIGILCFTPYIGPPLALLLGIGLTVVAGNVFDSDRINKTTSWLLKASVVGLGFGMNFNAAVKTGRNAFILTIGSITATLVLGYYLGKKLDINSKISALISSGTAICGGSAIAAMYPVIDAKRQQVSIALGTVFILNSVALFLFPFIGHYLSLTQTQFGYWAAIAIHDTSSVVGAASAYGQQALKIATSVKLSRALWILPITFGASYYYKSGKDNVSIPYFIFLFVGAMLVNTFFPFLSSIVQPIVPLAEKGLTLTLFLIGTGLSVEMIKKVGIRPLLVGLLLWVTIASGSLAAIYYLFA